MESLVMRRIALDRERTFGRIQLAVGIAFLAFGVIIVLGESNRMLAVLQVAVGVVWVLLGIRQVRRASRNEQAFDLEHGVDAGRQLPR